MILIFRKDIKTCIVCVLRLSYDYEVLNFRNPDEIRSSSLMLDMSGFELGIVFV